MSCPDLAIPRSAAASNRAKVTANDTLDRFDEAITGRLTIDLAAGDGPIPPTGASPSTADQLLAATRCRTHETP